MKYRIKVSNVGPGVFSNEVSATVRVGDQSYTLIVPDRYVTNDTIEVEFVAKRGDDALVNLPRETFTSGSRIMVPMADLISA